MPTLWQGDCGKNGADGQSPKHDINVTAVKPVVPRFGSQGNGIASQNTYMVVILPC